MSSDDVPMPDFEELAAAAAAEGIKGSVTEDIDAEVDLGLDDDDGADLDDDELGEG